LKHFRRVATRYDKIAANFLAMVQPASMRLWLRAYESTAGFGAFSKRGDLVATFCCIGFLPHASDAKFQSDSYIGAGEGNRTLVFSLEGCCSTIELHPRFQ
jgi:hypothetical protein